MKICMVMGGNEEGGLEKHYVELCNALATHGHVQVVAICCEKYHARFNSAVETVGLDMTRSRRNPVALWQLMRVLRQHAPDIVHTQANKATCMVAAIRRFLPCAKIATIHNSKRRIRCFQKLDHVVAVSPQAISGIDIAPVTVIRNGIEPPKNVRAIERRELSTLGLDPHLPLFLSVGRCVPVKGFAELIETWREIEANLLIIGDGPQLSQLKTLAKQHELQHRVAFLGHRDDVPNWIAAADTVLVASRHEGFNYVVLESLLAQKPVLMTPVGGWQDILPPEAFMGFDVSEIKSKIQDYMAKPGSIDFTTTFTWVAENLTLQASIDKYLQLYRDVLEEQAS